MSVKVLIERKLSQEPSPELVKVINELRIGAMEQPGYIGGETLMGLDSDEVVVISTWSSEEDWRNWLVNPRRQALEDSLGKYLESPTVTRAFVQGADYVRDLIGKS